MRRAIGVAGRWRKRIRPTEPDYWDRAEQLSELHASLARPVSGSRCTTVLVAGEAGIGKTMLLRHIVRHLRSVQVFWTAYDPLFTPPAARTRAEKCAGPG